VFLAESGALFDRGATGDEVLDTFAELAIERGNAYCVAEELAGPKLPVPELDLGRVSAGDATVLSQDDRPRAEAARRQARLLAQTQRTTSTHAAVLRAPGGQVQPAPLGWARRAGPSTRGLTVGRSRA
jgi:hypothetical protein